MSASADIPQARSGTRLFPGRAEHITNVRWYLAELLGGCPLAEEAILCGSELAANAAIHSRSSQPGGHFAVRAHVCPGEYIRIEVGDQGGPWIESRHADDHPHGLDLVKTLAGDGNWGVGGGPGGRVAWVRLSYTVAHSASAAACTPIRG